MLAGAVLVIGIFIIRVFAFPLFNFRVIRSFNFLSEATVEAAAHAQCVARSFPVLPNHFNSHRFLFLHHRAQCSFSVFPYYALAGMQFPRMRVTCTGEAFENSAVSFSTRTAAAAVRLQQCPTEMNRIRDGYP
jgi:hypothetical protein